jgi:regulator of ribosome biosynthesis
VTQPGEDPFTKQRTDKRERVRKQAKQQLANAKAAAKAGTLPPTLRLAAALPEHGKGRPAKRKEMRDELKSATLQAAVSTASMGKFDRLARGEKPEDRQPRGKKRKFAPVADKVRAN